MKIKKIILCCILLANTATSNAAGKETWPGDIMGRDLQSDIMGWVGHLGIATESMTSAAGMPQHASMVIEVLNEPIVIQINYTTDFARRSKYWGSKWGVATYDQQGYRMLVEANHQRWWGAEYTITTDYKPGAGNPKTGAIFYPGKWRCDTFVYWIYLYGGWDLYHGSMSPAAMFNAAPRFNDRLLSGPFLNSRNPGLKGKTTADITVDELNTMNIEDMQMIVDTPATNYVSYEVPYSQMEFAKNPDVKIEKRQFMLDTAIAQDAMPGIIDELIRMFAVERDPEMIDTIVSRMYLYFQYNVRNKSPKTEDMEKIRRFFELVLQSDKLTQKQAERGVQGYVDSHSADEVVANLDRINAALTQTNHVASIQTKYLLAFKSPRLQTLYIQSIVDELMAANDSDLDSYFLGPLSIGLENTGSSLLNLESQEIIRGFLRSRESRYSAEGIMANKKDHYRGMTAIEYNKVKKMLK
ncbi:hypothetical protein [Legionella sp. CNM-4043-24]|uniref:hypothetical protein n=1 Tax=Legionella sp. CNM-4043-24 TaxID=3421646 RepID=UPI00403A8359